MTRKKTDETEAREGTFEQALERLETIVGQMEDGSLGLDEMMARFEEGQSLIRFCTGKLNEVEKKVELLLKKGDAVEAVPFESGPGEPEGPDK
jgi:exodeoxyribonuclease VII small subunit